MVVSKKEVSPALKAKELVAKHGVKIADEVVNSLLTEIQGIGWDQKRIDYYLDVKNCIKIIEAFKKTK